MPDLEVFGPRELERLGAHVLRAQMEFSADLMGHLDLNERDDLFGAGPEFGAPFKPDVDVKPLMGSSDLDPSAVPLERREAVRRRVRTPRAS